MRIRGLIPLFVMLLAPGMTTAALTVVTASSDPSFKTSIDLVPLDVCVRDPSGRPVPNLTASDFLILENGIPQEVSFITPPEEMPLHVVLLLDISSSMYGVKLDRAIEAASSFAALLRPGDRLEVIAFNQRAIPIYAFDQDPTAAALRIGPRVRSIVGLGLAASTALYDALLIAIEDLLRSHSAGVAGDRDVVVVVSDGEDTVSRIGFEELLPVARRSAVLVYTVSLRANERGEWLGASWPLLQLAVETGARAVGVPRVEGVVDLYREINSEVRQMYRLAYVSQDTRRDGRWRQISVRLVKVAGRANTRAGYYAPR